MNEVLSAVVVDTMVVSALVHATRQADPAAAYRSLVAGRPIVVSFVTITELRYGALKAGWGDLRRRGFERDLARLVIVQPEDALLQVCARLRPGARQQDTVSVRRSTRQTDGSQQLRSGSALIRCPTTPSSAMFQD